MKNLLSSLHRLFSFINYIKSGLILFLVLVLTIWMIGSEDFQQDIDFEHLSFYEKTDNFIIMYLTILSITTLSIIIYISHFVGVKKTILFVKSYLKRNSKILLLTVLIIFSYVIYRSIGNEFLFLLNL